MGSMSVYPGVGTCLEDHAIIHAVCKMNSLLYKQLTYFLQSLPFTLQTMRQHSVDDDINQMST